ncbi:hypothetical protein [Spiroplasma endosymbiont of Nebria brevicollis]|uniref:hypothetical protein n=1 Tax=Spiroplasma endosymbiont of Nebria brevicollis TaxID=3066284 RepID=UPI00313E0FD3
MDNIEEEEQLLPTNSTSCLSTSSVKKYFLNMMRKTKYVLYIVGTGCLLYGGGSGLNELIENGYDKNEKTSDNDSYLEFFLVGFGAITIGQSLKLFVKFCDNGNNIENRLDQQPTHDLPPAYEDIQGHILKMLIMRPHTPILPVNLMLLNAHPSSYRLPNQTLQIP